MGQTIIKKKNSIHIHFKTNPMMSDDKNEPKAITRKSMLVKISNTAKFQNSGPKRHAQNIRHLNNSKKKNTDKPMCGSKAWVD